MSLMMHAVTADLLQKITHHLPHALLLSGDVGVGLGSIAKEVARSHSSHPTVILPEKDEVVDLEKGSITVDGIRRLYNDTRTKQATKRIFVIDYAERMTIQAQNAFLKLLEEPREGTHFILASHDPQRLLPTTRSRMQHQEIRRITPQQSNSLLDALDVKDVTKRSQLLFMAEGLPAEISRLAINETYFEERVSIVRHARTLLQGSDYEKVMIAHLYQSDRPKALLLLQNASRIIRHSLDTQPQIAMINQLEKLLVTMQRIESNGNIRLLLARFVL